MAPWAQPRAGVTLQQLHWLLPVLVVGLEVGILLHSANNLGARGWDHPESLRQQAPGGRQHAEVTEQTGKRSLGP